MVATQSFAAIPFAAGTIRRIATGTIVLAPGATLILLSRTRFPGGLPHVFTFLETPIADPTLTSTWGEFPIQAVPLIPNNMGFSFAKVSPFQGREDYSLMVTNNIDDPLGVPIAAVAAFYSVEIAP